MDNPINVKIYNRDILGIILLLTIYIVGVILSKGFWSTFFAVIFPPYDLYLIIDKWLVPLM